jgi:hypothetical protein
VQQIGDPAGHRALQAAALAVQLALADLALVAFASTEPQRPVGAAARAAKQRQKRLAQRPAAYE